MTIEEYLEKAIEEYICTGEIRKLKTFVVEMSIKGYFSKEITTSLTNLIVYECSKTKEDRCLFKRAFENVLNKTDKNNKELFKHELFNPVFSEEEISYVFMYMPDVLLVCNKLVLVIVNILFSIDINIFKSVKKLDKYIHENCETFIEDVDCIEKLPEDDYKIVFTPLGDQYFGVLNVITGEVQIVKYSYGGYSSGLYGIKNNALMKKESDGKWNRVYTLNKLKAHCFDENDNLIIYPRIPRMYMFEAFRINVKEHKKIKGKFPEFIVRKIIWRIILSKLYETTLIDEIMSPHLDNVNLFYKIIYCELVPEIITPRIIYKTIDELKEKGLMKDNTMSDAFINIVDYISKAGGEDKNCLDTLLAISSIHFSLDQPCTLFNNKFAQSFCENTRYMPMIKNNEMKKLYFHLQMDYEYYNAKDYIKELNKR